MCIYIEFKLYIYFYILHHFLNPKSTRFIDNFNSRSRLEKS